MSDRRPWRPPIRAVLILMLLIAVMTPMVGMFFFRVFENQLIRKTEAELIAQSAAIAAVYRREAQEAKMPKSGMVDLPKNRHPCSRKRATDGASALARVPPSGWAAEPR